MGERGVTGGLKPLGDALAFLGGLVLRQLERRAPCLHLKREADGLERVTYPGDLGKRLWENVSKEAWAGWLKHQTMLVNENRLNLADARARKYLLQQMEKHFFGEGAVMGLMAPQSADSHLPWPSIVMFCGLPWCWLVITIFML